MNNMHLLRSILLTLILEFIIMRPSEGLSLNVTSQHCVFPFSLGSHFYDSCIPNNRMDNAYWCSTTPNYDRDLQWEFCTILGAEGNSVIARCHFPFIFEAQSFTSCTKEGRSDGQLWCSTTPNYDKDGHWIFCTRPVSIPSNNLKFQLILSVCLGFALLWVFIAGCCMWVQWSGVKRGMWWSSRRGVLDQGKDKENMDEPESIYENIDSKGPKETTHV